MKIASEVVTWILVILVVLMSFSLVSMKITGGPPTIAGQRMYIVLSGSMEPAIKTGSLLFIKPVAPESLVAGDVITFRGLGGRESLISHRVVSVLESAQGSTFITKGDANEVEDPNPVQADHIVGKMTLAMPYLGYFMYYSQSKQGGMILLMASGVILLIYGGSSLYKQRKAVKDV